MSSVRGTGTWADTWADHAIRRILSALGDHVLTGDLDRALVDLADALAAAGRSDRAAAVERARSALELSVGTLNSRGTRVPMEK